MKPRSLGLHDREGRHRLKGGAARALLRTRQNGHVSVLAVLGRGLLPADTPFIRADDLGLTRGDGIFETIHVRHGKPWMLDEHLARMARSAVRMDLALPDLRELAELACEPWPVDQEGALKLVCTRGPDGTDEVTCYATLTPVSTKAIELRSTFPARTSGWLRMAV